MRCLSEFAVTKNSSCDLDARQQIVQIEYENGLGSRMMLPVLRRGISIPPRRQASYSIASGRRTFLTLGAAAAGGALFGRGRAEAGEAFPPKDAPWSQIARRRHRRSALWPAVGFRKDVIRRNVPWLTASKESSVSFSPLQDLQRHHHAQRAVLRAPPCRPRRGRSGAAPADDPRPGRAAACCSP